MMGRVLRHATPGLGATPAPDATCRFLVWAPHAPRVDVVVGDPPERVEPLQRDAAGYHAGRVDDVPPGTLYRYRLHLAGGARDLADPASRHQPQGVAGPSRVVDPAYAWNDESWRGRPLASFVIYEVHVGTYTAEGTFDALAPRLDDLVDLGVTALELMPVAAFPGTRNWGYDGVFPYAVQDSYGGPDGLRRLVDACHARGLAVVLDVVHNHLGPEGNHLAAFGPYFTDAYRTPWGAAINYDGPHSHHVRGFFLESASRWIDDYHVDALRLDAVHAILDTNAVPFIQELAAAVHAAGARRGRPAYTIPESDANEPRLVRPVDRGGLGHDAAWSDDFHHALHALLTGEAAGYYADYGRLDHLARAFSDGFVLAGQVSRYRQRPHGAPAPDVDADRFVVFAQNHDQVGNRARGDRLATLVPFAAQKLAAATVITSPYVPLLFMGEEYGETAPFQYFVDHDDPALVRAVREGRRRDFAAFAWGGAVPDPQDPATFERSRPDPSLARRESHRTLRAWHRELLRLRREHPVLAHPTRQGMTVDVDEDSQALLVGRRSAEGDAETLAIHHFGDAPHTLDRTWPSGRWRAVLDSEDARWGGDGAGPRDIAVAGGRLQIPLPAYAFLLLERRSGA